MHKMINQPTNGERNRSRSKNSRLVGPGQASQPGGNNQSRWQQKYDHYCHLAQQADGSDDITREHYWQHAEHFLRLINGSSL
jgi:hypothetical protein